MAKSLVCTLFDGDYHLGAAALLNSLHERGFTGTFCAGYRGALPPWAAGRTEPGPQGTQRLRLERCDVLFFPVNTKQNLAYYKVIFIADVWRALGHDADYIFFFDADTFIVAQWSFFESWADLGVALVADGNTPMPHSHPVRAAWRKFYEPHGYKFKQAFDYYYNAGFSGFSLNQIKALEAWEKVYRLMETEVDLSLPISLTGAPAWQRSRAFPFYLPDQDALNIIADLDFVTISVIGSEGMGWKQPTDFMHHACYGPKPWRKGYIRRALRGVPPSHCDFVFWHNASTPIALGTPAEIKAVHRHMSIAQRLAKLGAVFNLR